MTSLEQRLRSTLGKLDSSPLFQLSLASKELFHSNFLAWLGRVCEEQVGRLFANYLPEAPSAFAPLAIRREEKKIDLTIEYPDGQELVIENKVKSLPRKAQLEEYATSFRRKKAKRGFLLLSLARPEFLSEDGCTVLLDSGIRWHYLSYRDLEPTDKT